MKRLINPMVDCVFKGLFGVQEHVDLLAHFLNSLLEPPDPLVDLILDNPIVPAQSSKDDHRVVDVLARDRAGRAYQIEVQLYLHACLRERALYTWADLYQTQMQSGSRFHELRPVISIWILDQNLLRGLPHWHNRFHVREARSGQRLTDHLEIHTLELRKLALQSDEGLDAATRWAYFLKEARHWDALPDPLRTPELRKAMSILDQWKEKDADYRAYRARMNALRVQATFEEEQRRLEAERERLLADNAQLAADKQRLAGDNAQLEAEIARLRALLATPTQGPEGR